MEISPGIKQENKKSLKSQPTKNISQNIIQQMGGNDVLYTVVVQMYKDIFVDDRIQQHFKVTEIEKYI